MKVMKKNRVENESLVDQKENRKRISFREMYSNSKIMIKTYPIPVLILILLTCELCRRISTGIYYENRILFLGSAFLIMLCGRSISEKENRVKKNKGTSILGDLMGAILVAGLGWILFSQKMITIETETRIILFSLAAFLLFLMPSFILINKKENSIDQIDFQNSFLGAFLSFFKTILFTGVGYLGILLILSAVEVLIIRVPTDVYSYLATIIFVLFAPILFLWEYQKRREEALEKKSEIPVFLKILLIKIMIPLLMIYFFILYLYLGLHLGNTFWEEPLFQPLLIGASTAFTILCLLVMKIKDPFVSWFMKWTPLILLPLVILQLISSGREILLNGLFINQYFEILSGLFFLAIAILVFFLRNRSSNIMGVLFILLCMIAVLPYMNGFYLSDHSQIKRLTEELEKNQMLADGQIIANTEIGTQSKEKITLAVLYLEQMDALDQVNYIPENFDVYTDSYSVFGFELTETVYADSRESYYGTIDQEELYRTTDSAYFIQLSITADTSGLNGDNEILREFICNGKELRCIKADVDDQEFIQIVDEKGTVYISFSLNEIKQALLQEYMEITSSEVNYSLEEGTFSYQGEHGTGDLIVQDFIWNEGSGEEYFSMDISLFFQIFN